MHEMMTNRRVFLVLASLLGTLPRSASAFIADVPEGVVPPADAIRDGQCHLARAISLLAGARNGIREALQDAVNSFRAAASSLEELVGTLGPDSQQPVEPLRFLNGIDSLAVDGVDVDVSNLGTILDTLRQMLTGIASRIEVILQSGLDTVDSDVVNVFRLSGGIGLLQASAFGLLNQLKL
jgi:hypothetical protein